MQCRAPTSAVTCAGATPTGASLTYDAERRLSHWQNAQTNPTVQAWYLYDGSGQRVEQYVSGGSGNHSYYLPGGVEEVAPSGSLIKYYSAGGMTLGLNTAHDASGISYLASDGLGSVSEALNSSGSATGAVLYSPYGGVRYTSGTMPTSRGFTGQYSDTASSGLDYYGARYYDPALGQFTSADTANDGLNRYGYVKGNPETATDPTGHMLCGYSAGSACKGYPPRPGSGGGGGGGSSGFSGGDCTSKVSCGCHTNCGGGGGGGGKPTDGGCTSDANCGCYGSCSAPTGSPCGGCSIAAIPSSVTAPSQSVHVSGQPRNFWDWGEFAVAIFRAGAAVVLLAAAFSTWEANPLAAMAFFVNGITQLIHAAASIAKITAGEGSGIYQMLSGLGVTADYIATMTDIIALDPEAAAGEVILPLLKNTNALTALGSLLGVDLVSDVEDFKELITAHGTPA